MLVEIAIGDAYGAAFEYAKEMQKHNDLQRYYKHPRHDVYPGQYTDDTQMSIAITEAILSGKRWNASTIAYYFVHCFKRDWRDGYARGFQKFLESISSWSEFLEKIRPDSDKSGGAMRACPVGIYPTIEEVLEKSSIQASLTHNTTDGIAAAQAVSLATHYFLYNLGPVSDLGKFIDSHVGGGYAWDEDWKGKVKSKGWMSSKAAITAIKRNNSLSSLLKDCISFGGDTDTVAAIAMGIASGSNEYSKDLDRCGCLVSQLENGAYGLDYLRELDKKLLDKQKELSDAIHQDTNETT